MLMIFLRNNLPNFMYFEVYRTWTGGDGNCFLSRRIILEEEVGPPNPARGSGERCKLPSGVWGGAPAKIDFWCNENKMKHLVA